MIVAPSLQNTFHSFSLLIDRTLHRASARGVHVFFNNFSHALAEASYILIDTLATLLISWHEERKVLNGFNKPDSIDTDEAHSIVVSKLGIFPLLAGAIYLNLADD